MIVSVPETNFASSGGIIPDGGTLADSIEWKTFWGRDYNKKFSGFRYLTQLEDTRDGGQLLFARALSQKKRDTPFRTTTRKGNHYWHPILLKFIPFPVKTFPLATQVGTTTINAVRYVIREEFVPAATEGSIFKKEEFVSDVPYKIGKSPVPIASFISYDFINRGGGFPECLHDKIIIKNLETTTGNKMPGQIFLATNFTTWRPYVLTDDQELTQGVYYRVKITVYPPAFPETVKRFATF